MTVTITDGPSDWSISSENGKDWAEFVYTHPTLNHITKLHYRFTGPYGGMDLEGPLQACQGNSGESFPGFGAGTYTFQIFEMDYTDWHESRDDSNPTVVHSSNTWSWEVTA